MPTAKARIALHLKGGLWSEKGMVSRQHEQGEERAGWGGVAGSLGSRLPAGGKLAVPTVSASQRDQGWRWGTGESVGMRLGRRARKDSYPCGSVNGSDSPPDPLVTSGPFTCKFSQGLEA